MAATDSVSHDELVVCACGAAAYTIRDAIEAALFRGELEQPWQGFLRRVAAEKQANENDDLELDEEAFDAAAEKFRYDHDLITAEETEAWLSARGLTLDDFSDYFSRQIWVQMLPDAGPEDIDFLSAPAELKDLFAIEMILSGRLEQMTTQLSWRLAALAAEREGVDAAEVAAEKQNFAERMKIDDARAWLERLGRDEEWLEHRAAMEAAYRKHRQSLLGPNAYAKELVTLRLPLTRFEIEVIELESRDAAHEALFCVREDGMAMEEVATEGRYPYKRIDFILEDIDPDVQQRFLSVAAGQVLEPNARGDGYELCRIVNRVEPHPDDPAVQSRIEQRLMERHFSDISSKHVERRLGAARISE